MNLKSAFCLLLSAFCFLPLSAFSQNRYIARGAEPGELYLSYFWYGIYYGGHPYYDTLRTAMFRLTEYGKELTIQYDADYFADYYTPIGSVMQPLLILADATPGVLYNKCFSYDYEWHVSTTQLWVSFDYGKNWIFREENYGHTNYHTANLDGVIHRGYYRSFDYGYTFSETTHGIGGAEPGLQYGEGFSLWSHRLLRYSHDFGQTVIEIPIDSQYVFGTIFIDPDVYRGGLPGEVYVISEFIEFPEPKYILNYKVSFSADTGYTFRHVFISEPYHVDFPAIPLFMSDREPGVFYIIWYYEVEDFNPWGWHTKICVEYYRDYGETLVDTYCHDITKDYNIEVGVKEISVDEDVLLFPNPTAGQFSILNSQFSIINVEVFDIYGKKLLEQKAEGRKQKEIDISNLQAGIYFVKISTEKGITVKKVIKQ